MVGKDKVKLHLLVALMIFSLVKWILPVNSGLTPAGASIIAIFIASIYMWLTIGTVWPSMLSLAAIVMTNITTAKEIWQISWGSYIIVYLMTMMMINCAISKSGLTRHMALWFVTRKIVKNRPYVFMGMFLLACLLLTFIMDMVPVLIVFISLAEQICAELGYNKNDKFFKSLFLGMMGLNIVGYGATPIGHAVPLAVFIVVETALGVNISYIKYMLVGIPFALAFYIIVMLVIRFLIRPDVSRFSNYDLEAKRSEIKSLTKRGKVVLVIFISMIFLWLFPELGKSLLPEIADYVSRMSIVVPALLALVLLCIIRIDGNPLLDINDALANVSWGMLIFMATINAISGCISMEASGIAEFLENLFRPVAEKIPPSLIVGVGLLMAIALTQLMTNALTGIIIFAAFSPILMSLPETIDMTLPFGCLLIMVVSVAFLTPASNPCAPMIFSKGYVDMKDSLKYGSAMIFLAYFAALFLIWPWAQFVF